ncbi:hypothetical protein P7C71_g1825, partial [Lecanoromycetidae sp. Uapishka_2]
MTTCGNVGNNTVFYSYGIGAGKATAFAETLSPRGVTFNDALDFSFIQKMTKFNLGAGSSPRTILFIQRWEEAMASILFGTVYLVLPNGYRAYSPPGTERNDWYNIEFPVERTTHRLSVAADDIDEDEELFSIARSTLLTVQSSGLQNAKADILESLDAWNALVLSLIYEDGLEKRSTWWPYLNILPSAFDTLMYWNASELAELQGSAVLDKIGKQDADEAFKKCLLPVVQQNSELFGKHSQAFGSADAEAALLSLAHRMATLIMAYGFDLEADGSSSEEDEADGSSQSAYELNKGMIPLADLFNADGDLNNVGLIACLHCHTR